MAIKIAADQIHLYWTSLDLLPDAVDRLAALLEANELSRAGRFYFEAHRRRYVVAHGVLRTLLGDYLDMPPEQISVIRSDNGKPGLENPVNGKHICFNISHSHELAFYGFCIDRQVGVDIEYIRPMAEMANIAERFFPSAEARRIASADEGEQEKLFFRYWTLKEACLKATGEGIRGLRKMEIHEKGDENYEVREKSASSDADWTIRPVAIQAGYAAAVAVEGAFDPEIRLYRFYFSNSGQILTDA